MKWKMKKPGFKEKQISDFESVFTMEPYERGFGTTIGNALRRVLMSSLSKFAPVAIRLSVSRKVQMGRRKKESDPLETLAKHELDVLQGIYEDVFGIILNVRQLVFTVDKKDDENGELMEITIEGAKGKVKGKDLKLPAGVRLINPEQLVFTATPNDEVISVSLVIYIKEGRGYWKASENKRLQLINEKLDTYAIAIDSNFSPVKKVAFEITELAGYDKPHEKLALKITTDGSITPRQALEDATYILKYHFDELIAKNKEGEKKVKEVITSQDNPLISAATDLDKKTRGALKEENIKYIDELVVKKVTKEVDEARIRKIAKLDVDSQNKLIEYIQKHLEKGENLPK